jgi:hypothetical protein
MAQNRKRVVMPGDLTPFKRVLDAITYKTTGSGSIQLFRDSVLEGFMIVIFGSFVAAWSSGTPISDPRGAFNLISNIKLAVNFSKGSRQMIDLDPQILRTKQLIRFGKMPEERSTVGSSATVDPKADAVPQFGTTTQTTSFRASLRLSFKDIMASGLLGQNTILDLRDAVSADLKFGFNQPSALQRADDTTAITYSSVNISIKVDPIAETFQPFNGASPYDLVQSYKVANFASQTKALIELPVGNSIRGLTLVCRNGDAARSFVDTAIGAWRIKAGGRTLLEGNWQDSQSELRDRFTALNIPYSSSKNDLQGRLYLDFTKQGVLETGLDLSTVKQAYLELESAASGTDGATYSSAAVEVLVGWDEITHKIDSAAAA